MRNWWGLAGLLAMLACAPPASAAIATAPIVVAIGDWTDLGTGAILVQAPRQAVYYAIADVKPDPASSGFTTGETPYAFQTGSHVWARAAGVAQNGLAAPATVTINVVAQASAGVASNYPDSSADAALGAPSDAAAASSGSSGSIAAYLRAMRDKQIAGVIVAGADAAGAAPTKPPMMIGLLDGSGNVQRVSPAFPLPTADSVAGAGIGAPGDTPAAVGGNGSAVAQLKQAVSQLSTQVTRLNTIITTLGSPFQAGGSIGNTGFNALQNNAANASGNPFFAQITNFPATQPVSGTVTGNIFGYYDLSLATFGAAGYGAMRMDKHGQAKVSETGSDDPLVGITATVAASATSAIGKASAGNLYSTYGLATAANSAQAYLVAINASAVPASGATITPVDFAAFSSNAVGASASINFGAGPPSTYSAGIVVLASTSLTTYTPAATSAINVRVR